MTVDALAAVRGNHRNYALAAMRRATAIKLRASGMTFQAVADELGYANKGTVHHIIGKAMHEVVAEAVEDRRRDEGARLDALQVGLWDKAMSGDVAAAMEVRRIILARIDLFGLCEPPGTPSAGGGKPRTVVVPEPD